MGKKYAAILATSLFFSSVSIPYSIFADDQSLSQAKSSATREVHEIALGESEDIKQVIQSQFDEELDDLKIAESDDGQVHFYNEKYTGVLSGLDTEQQGMQDVVMTLTEKQDLSKQNVADPMYSQNARTKVRLAHVNVADTEAPSIQSEDKYTTEVGQSLDFNALIQAKDNAGKVELDIDDHEVNFQEKGSYTVHVTAIDPAGNQTTKDITIEVEADFYQKIADAALAQIGVQQDCTMLVTNALKAVGINFHGAPSAYLSLGPLTNNPVPGDIVVYQGHVALYVGDGMAVHGGWNGGSTVLYSVNCSNPLIGYVHVNR